jgi:FlaA1/EpsC-like NDP-sugar epimerase
VLDRHHRIQRETIREWGGKFMSRLISHGVVQQRLKYLQRVGPWLLADAAILVTAYLTIYSIRIETFPAISNNHHQIAFLGGALAVALTALYLLGGYQRIWSRTSGHDVQVIVAAVGLSTLVTGIADWFLRPRPFPLSVVLVANFVALAGFSAIRYRSRLLSGLFWRWKVVWHEQFPVQAVRVLIVGAGDTGQVTAWRLKHRSPDGQRYDVIGFVDDDPAKQHMVVEGSRVLGTCEDIPYLVETHGVELVAVAIHNISGRDLRGILSCCELTPARIKIIPDVFAVIGSKTGTPLLRDIQAEDLLGRQPLAWHEEVDITPVSHKVVLVTGAAGSIGSELCRQILKYDPVKLIMLDNNESGLHDLVIELSHERTSGQLQPFLADITDRQSLNRLFAHYHPQVVFHSAAYKHVPMLEYHPNEAVRVNIGGTQQVAGLARDYGVERFVLISTDKAVNPSSIMGASKRVCELLMHSLAHQDGHRTLFTSVRFGNVLGSRGSVVPLFNRQIEVGGPVTVTDPEMTRYFMTIPEAVNLVIHAACLTTGGDLFMLRMGEVVRIVELAERMIRLRGLVPHKDIPIRYVGLRPGEKLHEQLRGDHEQEIPTRHPHIVKLVSRTNGLHPVSFSDRLDRLFQKGLDDTQEPLIQLREIIALGESHQLERVL